MSADDIFFWSNWVLVGALVLGLLATYAIVVSGNIRDKELRLELKDKDERIANANARAEEAKLELEKFKAPRTLEAEQQRRILDKVKNFAGTTFEIVTYPGQPESAGFSNVIGDILVRAGWVLNPNQSRGSLLGIASGVVIVVGKQAGAKAEETGNILLEALISEGVAAKLGSASLQVNPINIAIKIQVGTKPGRTQPKKRRFHHISRLPVVSNWA